MFGWHKEDMDLYSINYVHSGQPKFWYGIDLGSSESFEHYVHGHFKEQFKACSEFIRHKTTLVHPDNLLKNGIKLRRAIQRPGEFVISRAAAYHSGFNAGYNIAEAVNFALPEWIKVAEKAKSCQCVRDSVRIDLRAFKIAIGLQVPDLPDQVPTLTQKEDQSKKVPVALAKTKEKTLKKKEMSAIFIENAALNLADFNFDNEKPQTLLEQLDEICQPKRKESLQATPTEMKQK